VRLFPCPVLYLRAALASQTGRDGPGLASSSLSTGTILSQAVSGGLLTWQALGENLLDKLRKVRVDHYLLEGIQDGNTRPRVFLLLGYSFSAEVGLAKKVGFAPQFRLRDFLAVAGKRLGKSNSSSIKTSVETPAARA
jgi:hypothetical protein